MWQVTGHPKAVELLKRSLELERAAHAYLFVGPPHVGKTTLAVNLAQALNCEQNEPPCAECRSCLRIASGNHTDVQTISRPAEDSVLKKDISIGQVRELQQAASLRPYEGKHRVFIMDGAEYLNEESANCLLKTLEEPPEHVTIVLLVVDDSRLLSTIVSRCQRVDLSPLSPSLIEEALVDRWGLEQEKARILSRLSRGGIGWAISALRDEKLLQERAEKLDELVALGGAGIDSRFAFAGALASQFARSRRAVEETLRLWLEWWRDLLLARCGRTELVTNVDREDALLKGRGAYELIEIRRAMEAIIGALRQLEQNANPRLTLEVLMLNIPRGARTEGSVTSFAG